MTLPPCDRCGREVRPWPLKRPNVCSPDHWARCIRNDGIYAEESERRARALGKGLAGVQSFADSERHRRLTR